MSKIVLYPANGYDFDAADVAAYLAGLTSGVFSSDEDFSVTAAGGLKVTVGAGRGWVHPSRFTGYSITKRESDTLTLPLADPSLPRIDRVVMRYDAGARAADLQVLQGTASSTPTAPTISRTELIYDLCLAEITRPAGSTSITTGQITDTRLDEALCGIVRDGVTGIPTDELLAAAKERINALEEKATNSAAAAKDSEDAAALSETHAAASEKNAKASETAAQQILTDTQNAVKTVTANMNAAAGSASTAATKAGEASASAGAAATSRQAAEKAQKSAEDAAALAGTRAGTDKTLSVDGAPADAKTTGDALEGKADKSTVQDESGNAIFYSKAEVEAKIKEILAAQREEDLARIKFWASDDPTSPASFIGGTWERIENCTIWGASDTHPAGTTVEAGLPNITGGFGFSSYSGAGGWLLASSVTGAFKDRQGSGVLAQAGSAGVKGSVAVDMDASKSSQIYGASDTVQPPAYCMYIWRRVA